jgi:hypothetical protein
MSRIARLTIVGLMAVLAGPGRSVDARGPAEDDLAVVRRAVAQEPSTTSRETPPVPEKARAKKAEPQWLRVRIKDKSGKSTVSVNVPLALARALGEDVPLNWACRHKGNEGVKVRLGDVLAALDSGQEIVQVDSEDGTVRVWVE